LLKAKGKYSVKSNPGRCDIIFSNKLKEGRKSNKFIFAENFGSFSVIPSSNTLILPKRSLILSLIKGVIFLESHYE